MTDLDKQTHDDARPNCRDVSDCKAKTPGKHCSGCNMAALHRDPAFAEKRRMAFRNRLDNDPEFRARHGAASAARLAKWRAEPGNKLGQNERSLSNLELANTPEAKAARTLAIRRARLAGIPEDRWPEYRALARRMPAAEARRIITDQIATEKRRADALLTPFERQMARVAAGAQLLPAFKIARGELDYTPGGVASGML